MNSDTRYKVIFLDLFGVLIGTDQSAMIHAIAKRLNLDYHSCREIVTGELFMQLERGEITFDSYALNLSLSLPGGEGLTRDEIRTWFASRHLAELPLTGLLPRLQRSYQIWILSNTTTQHVKQLARQFPFLNSLNGWITSEAAQAAKPNTRIFQYALEQASGAAESSVFIDDNRQNAEAAKSLGITAWYHREYEETRRFLSSTLQIELVEERS